jgi:hypothetical protein
MSDNSVYSELAVERVIKEHFGIDADIRQAILLRVPVSQTAEATLFLTSKKQLYLFISAQSKLLFKDVKKIITNMGLKPDLYLPPKGRPAYFNEVGLSKFHEVFPGRSHVTDEDLMYYKTLAPYNPALILISEVKDGVVYRFDSDAKTSWRPAVRFAYRRIRTS